jgi:hypothetical protein
LAAFDRRDFECPITQSGLAANGPPKQVKFFARKPNKGGGAIFSADFQGRALIISISGACVPAAFNFP